MLTNKINESSMLVKDREDILELTANLVRENQDKSERLLSEKEEQKQELSEKLLREKEEKNQISDRLLMENLELKREVERWKFKGRVNGQLAYDKITAEEMWREILMFV